MSTAASAWRSSRERLVGADVELEDDAVETDLGVSLGVVGGRVGGAQVGDDLAGADDHLAAVLEHRHRLLTGQLAHLGTIGASQRDVDARVRQLELGHHLPHSVAVGAPFGLVEGQHAHLTSVGGRNISGQSLACAIVATRICPTANRCAIAVGPCPPRLRHRGDRGTARARRASKARPPAPGAGFRYRRVERAMSAVRAAGSEVGARQTPARQTKAAAWSASTA